MFLILKILLTSLIIKYYNYHLVACTGLKCLKCIGKNSRVRYVLVL